MHWSYFVTYEFYTIASGVVKGAQIVAPQGAWKKSEIAQIGAWLTVVYGLTSKTLLYTAGMKEERWPEWLQIWNSTLYAAGIGLDLYTALDCFFLGDSAAVSVWAQRKEKAKQLAKVGTAFIGCALLGVRIYYWVTEPQTKSDLYQARDVLNAISLMFAFDDTSLFVEKVGRKVAALVVGGETYVKLVAGAVHIAAIATE
jgi:hypothetical protein